MRKLSQVKKTECRDLTIEVRKKNKQIGFNKKTKKKWKKGVDKQ